MSKDVSFFLDKAREIFADVSGQIQNASEPLTLEDLCTLLESAEEGVTALNAAVNVAVDAEASNAIPNNPS